MIESMIDVGLTTLHQGVQRVREVTAEVESALGFVSKYAMVHVLSCLRIPDESIYQPTRS